jgi:hypothetical protein
MKMVGGQRERREGDGVRRVLELELKGRWNGLGKSGAKEARRSPSLITDIPVRIF